MNHSCLGITAIIIFFLLLLLFVVGVAATPEFTTVPVPLAATPIAANRAGAVPVLVQPVALSTNTPFIITTNGQADVTTYTVQAGDWLNDIARRYSTTVPAILAANPQITDPESIQPGLIIVLP